MNLNSNHLMDGMVVLGLLVAVIVFAWIARSKRNEK